MKRRNFLLAAVGAMPAVGVLAKWVPEPVTRRLGLSPLASAHGPSRFCVSAYVPHLAPHNGASGMPGNICEVIVYDRAVSASERQSIENYLATKWNRASHQLRHNRTT